MGFGVNLGLLTTIHSQTTSIQTQTNKLAGQVPVTGSSVNNWQAAEQTLVSIGAAGVNNKIHSVFVDISALVGNITVKAYTTVDGVEKMVFPAKAGTTFNVPAGDAAALAVIDGTIGLHEAIRITVESDNAADNGASVAWDAFLEAM